MKKIIVVGASAASMAFITKLRSFDKESTIFCFSAENFLPYNRCLLADFLTKDISCKEIFLKSDTFFSEYNIDLRLQHRAVRFDFQQKKVLVQHGALEQWYEYDYLFLGMGTRPFIPKFLQNNDIDGVFTFHTLQDMENIDRYVSTANPEHAVVMGAGLNGVEAASSLVQKGLTVTLIDTASQIMPGQLDSQAAAWVCNIIEKNNVRIIINQSVTAVRSDSNQLQSIMLADGREVKADLLIIAAGSVPNSDLLRGGDLVLDESLLKVDRCLKTNIESVFAAGDLCQVPDFRTGALIRSVTWSDAMLQGLCAATAFSAAPRLYMGAIGLRDSYFFGKNFYACGQTVGFDEQTEEQVISNDSDNFAKLYIIDRRLIGFLLIGDISRLSEFKQRYMTKS